MKAVVPVAGIGTRLQPFTFHLPKVLLPVAGKPMLGHIIDDLVNAGVDEIILIVGYLKEKVFQYIDDDYSDVKIHYIEQTEMLGLGHAIYMAKDFFDDEDMLIMLGDTIYDVDLKDFVSTKHNALGLKSVEDPRRFGVAETDPEKKWVVNLVEKPEKPKSNLALVGLYFIKNSKALFNSLSHIIDNNIRTKNEFQLTDALSHFIDTGYMMDAYQINGWHDCGLAETLLDTNKILLAKNKNQNKSYNNSIIIEPCAIHESAILENTIIGPNVSIGKDVVIKNSLIKNSIIDAKAELTNVNIDESIIGIEAKLNENMKTVFIAKNEQ